MHCLTFNPVSGEPTQYMSNEWAQYNLRDKIYTIYFDMKLNLRFEQFNQALHNHH